MSSSIDENGAMASDAGDDQLQGRVSSYYASQLEKYTSLQAHPISEGHVEQFLFNEKGVISLASRSVHFMNRRCLTLWHIEFVHMNEHSITTTNVLAEKQP